MNADWLPDPSGRFTQRFFDGSRWTEHVIGANGTTIADPLTESLPPPPPSAVPHPQAAYPPAAFAPAATAAPAKRSRALSWVGVVIAVVGVLLAGLSLYALDWADQTTAGDLRDGFPDPLPDGLPFADLLSVTYLRWGGLLLMVLVLVSLVVVAIGVAGRDGNVGRVLGALVAAAAATLQAVTVSRVFRGDGPDPALGAGLGTIGFLVVIAGLAIATPKDRRAS